MRPVGPLVRNRMGYTMSDNRYYVNFWGVARVESLPDILSCEG